MIRWPRRSRRRQGDQEEQAFDVWPALVDVLAAAFVFLLLAFFGLLTRDVAWQGTLAAREREAGEKLAREVACARKRAAHDHDVEEWKGQVLAAQRETVAAYLKVLRGHLDAAEMDEARATLLVGACKPGPAVDKLDDGDQELARRRDVLLICGIQSGEDSDSEETLIHFRVGDAEPDYAGGLLYALREAAADLLERSCSKESYPIADYCAAGFEIAGHADCIGTDAGRSYWKLSTDRAGSVIRDLMTYRLTNIARADLAFQIQASGYETRVAANSECSCDKTKDEWSRFPSCLAENRRVELRIKLKTKELPGRPKVPECEHDDK